MKEKERRNPKHGDPGAPGGPGDSDPATADREEAEVEGNPGEEILIAPEHEREPEPCGPEDVEGSVGATEAEPTPMPKEAEYLEDLRRVTAEFANYRRRLQRERADWDVRAKADLLTTLLPVLDDLRLARGYWSGRQVGKDAEGMLMILTRLEELLRSCGLEVQNTEPGTQFDPHRHEALATGYSEEYPEGAILETLQPGYLFRDILLRPARVRVSQGPPVETS